MPPADRKLQPDELGRTLPEDFRQAAKHPVRFVLDDIRSRHNVGAVFRTADAFALHGIDLCGFTARPPHREIEKTALGATRTVAWMGHAHTLDAVAALRAEGWQIWAVELTERAVPLPQWRPARLPGVALVLGNELHGVAEDVLAACDGALIIPQGGTKHSMNVSVCAGIVASWAVFRPWDIPGR
jgi:23S rRNA (guanosine2251-2'-O)-methyltransferase